MANNFKKVGDWGKANRLCNSLGGDINHATNVILKRIGLETERKVVMYIKKQPGTWKPLSEAYKQRKIKQGYSPLMLIRTSDYLQRITSNVNEAQKQVFIGVKKGVRNKEGDELVLIGAVMEYGRKGDKRNARPHFRPVHKLMLRKIKEKDLFGKGVLDYIKKKHGII